MPKKTGSSRRCDASAANIAFPPMIQSIDYSDPLTRLATITKPTVQPPRRPRDFRRAAYRTAEPVGRSGSRRWKTRRGTRTTPRYSPISTPNSTAWRSAFQRAFSGNPSYGFFRGNLQNVRSLPMTRFAADSPLEGDGFELVWGFSCQVVVFGFCRFFVRRCVQVRLACSAGDSPAGVKVRAP